MLLMTDRVMENLWLVPTGQRTRKEPYFPLKCSTIHPGFFSTRDGLRIYNTWITCRGRHSHINIEREGMGDREADIFKFSLNKFLTHFNFSLR